MVIIPVRRAFRGQAVSAQLFARRSSRSSRGWVRSRLLPLGVVLVARAKAAGQLRSDFEAPDVPLIQLMICTIIDGASDVDPDLWRRYM